METLLGILIGLGIITECLLICMWSLPIVIRYFKNKAVFLKNVVF